MSLKMQGGCGELGHHGFDVLHTWRVRLSLLDGWLSREGGPSRNVYRYET